MNILNHPATPLGRRGVLAGLALLGGGALISGCSRNNKQMGELLPPEPNADESRRLPTRSGSRANNDTQLMTLALNFEYLQAEYYTQVAYGQSLSQRGVPVGSNARRVRGGRKVKFSRKQFQDHAEELADGEGAHVRFFRRQLGSAVIDRPDIDFDSGFAALARAAGLSGSFDPFADEISFFLGAMFFEDLGVTAYHEAVALTTDKDLARSFAGVLGAEAYHVGMIRTLLWEFGLEGRDAAGRIAKARDMLDGPEDLDQGIELETRANIVPSDANGMVFARSARQALDILYVRPGASHGGFYPSGMRGDISALL